jgi:transmembrane sensor
MDYKNYQCEDFVADSYFRQWVLQPDKESSLFWNAFLAEHPEQVEIVLQASELVRLLADATTDLSHPTDPVEERTIWNNISTRVQAKGRFRGLPFLGRYRSNPQNWLVAAASVVIVLGISWWLYTGRQIQPGAHEQTVVAQTEGAWILKKNTSTHTQLISLPDGSSVVLQKNSQIKYARQLTGSKRVVHLVGEAYFEVTKDPARPFLVYTNTLVTKVLGTSFNVKAYAHDKDVVVTVRSGRVAVFSNTDEEEEKIDSPTIEGVVLTRNQQVVFARQEIKTIKPKTLPLAVAQKVFATQPERFVFEATPVNEVFAQLEKMYGVRIKYDKESLGKCRLTADLTDEPLANKMLIITKSIEANYTIDDNELTVSGPGCHP